MGGGKMTENDFREIFIPIASIKISSKERIENMVHVYFEVLKGFSKTTWKEVALKYCQIDDTERFPKPAEFKMMMWQHMGNKTEDYYQSEEYKRKCISPAALQSRREFWETVNRKFEEKRKQLKQDSLRLSGIGTFTEGIFEEVIERPIQRQSNYEERERKRQRIIQKANNADNI